MYLRLIEEYITKKKEEHESGCRILPDKCSASIAFNEWLFHIRDNLGSLEYEKALRELVNIDLLLSAPENKPKQKIDLILARLDEVGYQNEEIKEEFGRLEARMDQIGSKDFEMIIIGIIVNFGLKALHLN